MASTKQAIILFVMSGIRRPSTRLRDSHGCGNTSRAQDRTITWRNSIAAPEATLRPCGESSAGRRSNAGFSMSVRLSRDTADLGAGLVGGLLRRRLPRPGHGMVLWPPALRWPSSESVTGTRAAGQD